MYIINGTQNNASQGANIQGAPSTAPPAAPAAQNATTVGEQRGANKRTRDTMVAPGRNVQTDNNSQSSDPATNVANVTAIVSVAPTARIRRGIRDVAAPARQSSSSITVLQPATTAAQAIVLAEHPTAQAVPVASTSQQFTASAPRANLATPEYHLVDNNRHTTQVNTTGTQEIIMGIAIPALQRAKARAKAKPTTRKARGAPCPGTTILTN
jgi:hypothetical protein